MLISRDKLHELQVLEMEAFNRMFPNAEPGEGGLLFKVKGFKEREERRGPSIRHTHNLRYRKYKAYLERCYG